MVLKDRRLKILVTGSTGRFGSCITQKLINAGHNVIETSRNSRSNCDLLYLDITSIDSCNNVIKQCESLDVVVHCAAVANAKKRQISEGYYDMVNSRGTENILKASIKANVRQFILISSISVYGEFDLDNPLTEETTLKPIGMYGNSKKNAEDICREKQNNNISIFILRMAPMYSVEWPYNIRKKVCLPFFGKYFLHALESRLPRYSFCSFENGAEAVKWILENKMKPGIYNVADPDDYNLQTVIDVMQSIEGPKPVIGLPSALIEILFRFHIFLSINETRKQNAKSRYWKFLKSNIVSTYKLKSTGFRGKTILELNRESYPRV